MVGTVLERHGGANVDGKLGDQLANVSGRCARGMEYVCIRGKKR